MDISSFFTETQKAVWREQSERRSEAALLVCATLVYAA